MCGYYEEEVIKDTPARAAYKAGIDGFIENARACAEKERGRYLTPEKLLKKRDFYKKAFVDMLGFPLSCPPASGKTDMKKTFVVKDKNVNIFRMRLEIAGIPLYGILLEQENKDAQTPFVVCLHGGQGTPEMICGMHLGSANYNQLARRLTDRGCSVFCPQLLLWDTQRYGNVFDRKDIDAKLKQLGGSVTALELYLLSRAIDCFAENGICGKRLGVAGLSYGGMYALHLAAYDERICACLAEGQFNDRFRYSWTDWSYRGALKKFGDAEVAALICPRALAVCVGSNDELFCAETAKAEAEGVKPFYKTFGKENNFVFYVFEGVHEADRGDRGINFLLSHL